MASEKTLSFFVRSIVDEAEKRSGEKVSFFCKEEIELPEKYGATMFSIQVDVLSKTGASRSHRIRWIVPRENIFTDLQGRNWGVPWTLLPDPSQRKEEEKSKGKAPKALWREAWKRKDVPDLNVSLEYPAWYLPALSLFCNVARKENLGVVDVLRLEGRLNALWSGPFGILGRHLRADRVLEDGNPLKKLEAARRLEIKASSEGNGRLRRPHSSHEGRLCPFHTPESKRIGLQLYRSAAMTRRGERREGIDSEDLGSLLSLAVGLVPYVGHSDGPRLLMGGKNMKQAETAILGTEPAKVPGELESSGILREIVEKEHQKRGRLYPYLGINALVAVMPFDGYTYEDGLVVSRDFARKLGMEAQKSTQRLFCTLAMGKKDQGVLLQHRREWEAEMKERCEETFCFGDPLPLPKGILEYAGKEDFQVEYEERKGGILKSVTFRFLQHRFKGKSSKEKAGEGEEHLPVEVEITWHFSISRPLELGDKLTGRHGNKGVVTRIVDTPPRVIIQGRTLDVDLCISPCSILGRKNLGQVAEMVHGLGLWAKKEELLPHDVLVEPSRLMDGKEERGTWQELIGALENAKVLSQGTAEVLVEGRPEPVRAFVGYQYFCRLRHHASAKLQARGTRGPINDMTGQPSSGIPRGGQRLGEMENWAFLSHGTHDGFTGAHALRLLNNIREIPKGPENAEELLEDILYALGYVKEPLPGGKDFSWAPLSRGKEVVISKNEVSDYIRDKRKLDSSHGIISLWSPGRRKKEESPISREEQEEMEREVVQALAECLEKALTEDLLRPRDAKDVLVCWDEASPRGEDFLAPLREVLEKAAQMEEEKREEGVRKKYVPLSGLKLLRCGGIPWAKNIFTWGEESRPLPRASLIRLSGVLYSLANLPADPENGDRSKKEEKREKDFRKVLNGLNGYCRELESLVKGKNGYLRKHCIGRRCNHSGRAVIVPDPTLRVDEVRLPVMMLLEMLQGHSSLQRLGWEEELDALFNRARRGEHLREIAEDCNFVLQEEERSLWALLIRQPSLHRHSLQAFRVSVWEHNVIGLPPLVTPGFNADFDGDTMAVYLPHEEDQRKSRFLSLRKSPGKTGDGVLQLASDKDLALGWCHLSDKRRAELLAEISETSREPFRNAPPEDGGLTLQEYFHALAAQKGEDLWDDLGGLQKELCEASTGAATISPWELQELYEALEPKRNKFPEVLSRELVKGESEEDFVKALKTFEEETEGFIKEWLEGHRNFSLARLVLGKARGKAKDLRQIGAFLGYQERYVGDEEGIPPKEGWIQGSLWGGLSAEELFIYSYASRDAMASKKLAVAPAGHLTWKLAEGLYNLILKDGLCRSGKGILLEWNRKENALTVLRIGDETYEEPLRLPGKVEEALENLAWGRVPLGMERGLGREDLRGLVSSWNDEKETSSLAEDLRKHLEEQGGRLLLRSPLTCSYAEKGSLCAGCYGADMARKPFDLPGRTEPLSLLPPGTPVGLTAAEAIGERGTQLAMKRFHQVGGTSDGDRLQRLDRLFVWRTPVNRKQPTQAERFKTLIEILTQKKKREEGKGEDIERYKELPQQMIHFETALLFPKGLHMAATAPELPLPLRMIRDVQEIWKGPHESPEEVRGNLKGAIFSLKNRDAEETPKGGER